MNRTQVSVRKGALFQLRLSLVGVTVVVMVALVIGSWVFVAGTDRVQSHPFFSGETVRRGWSFLRDLFGVGASSTPAFLQGVEWARAARLAYQTLAMSVLGTAIAGMVALLTFVFGARNVMVGELAPRGWSAWRALFFMVVRGVYILSRGVPELVWAMVLVFVFSPGVLAGALALAVHNAGVLGKLASEVVEELDPRPLRALRSSGAGGLKVLVFGVLPEALPKLLTYLFYRWEIIIRTTVVVGFVAAGGLGMQFRLSMSHLHYTSVTLLLAWYLLLVVAVDLLAAFFRRLAR